MIAEVIERENVVQIMNEKYNEIKVKNKIEEELKKLEYNFSYKGTVYLVDAIYVLYNLKKAGECNLGEEVYPIVAQHYNTVSNNIKCNITNSTDKMFYDCEEKVLRAYLKEFTFTKPGPKKIMEAVLKRI